ncbi:type 1 glutamine amidotransferase domain-containing protein [Gramella sp. KN1008]|uniref:type 1 glutamine amidotransferase domain-containing protein n=1 Tax=Gramella sp. KN1008 TaxID=2529298 RepID=UPI001039E802|nr:type 1 glutamine amidotransferase domain-containing protein [Gramella sp. KN1008]TBW26560.1 type 1 glutamine amidotransferase domain-containing protein [Gramella sp. KN1008]
MQRLKSYLVFFLVVGLTLPVKSQNKILFVTSNQHTYGDLKKDAANHFEEIVVAFDEFKKAGYKVDFVSPEGGAIPLGYIRTSDPVQKHYLYDSSFMNLLKNTKRPDEIKASGYLAVYYSGGGAAMFGVPDNKSIQELTSFIYLKGGVVSAICHGTAGLVNVKLPDGKYIYEGKKISGFPDAFETLDADYYKQFPFSIEKKLKENGGEYKYSQRGWDGFYVYDGRLVSGQDPSGSRLVAQKVIETIKNQ